MADAPVGDDQFGEDPTTNRLQEKVAALLDKEAALWLPAGTMANQVALRLLTLPGDDVIVSRESHALWHETGASAGAVAGGVVGPSIALFSAFSDAGKTTRFRPK